MPGVCSRTVQMSLELGRSSSTGRSTVSRTPLPRRSRGRRETAATLSVMPASPSWSRTSMMEPVSTTTSAGGESSNPGCLAVMLHAPGWRPAKPNRPDGPAACSRRIPRPASTRDTRAPGRTPPVASSTTPSTPPVGCARPGAGKGHEQRAEGSRQQMDAPSRRRGGEGDRRPEAPQGFIRCWRM